MKQNFKLTKDQQTLVEKNLSIVHWVIVNNIHVNPGICGLEYGDLFQEGCLWLCKAAFTYHAGQAQFSTYAKKVVKNPNHRRLRSPAAHFDSNSFGRMCITNTKKLMRSIWLP